MKKKFFLFFKETLFIWCYKINPFKIFINKFQKTKKLKVNIDLMWMYVILYIKNLKKKKEKKNRKKHF